MGSLLEQLLTTKWRAANASRILVLSIAQGLGVEVFFIQWYTLQEEQRQEHSLCETGKVRVVASFACRGVLSVRAGSVVDDGVLRDWCQVGRGGTMDAALAGHVDGSRMTMLCGGTEAEAEARRRRCGRRRRRRHGRLLTIAHKRAALYLSPVVV